MRHDTRPLTLALTLSLACAATALAQQPLELLGVASTIDAPKPGELRLVVDPKIEKNLDLNQFRTTAGELEPPDEEDESPRKPERKGLAKVPASGSSQFSAAGLDALLAKLPTRKVVIVDLREEAHLIVGGVPVSWANEENNANAGISPAGLRSQERSRELFLRARPTIVAVRPSKKGPEKDEQLVLPTDDTMTEKELCASRGVLYARIPVTDHNRPADDDVDRFLKLVRLARGRWFHFHCKAGKGRTTTFMTMLDCVVNARRLDVREIAYRQHRLGGSNLIEGTPDAGEEETSRARAAFLERFHEYCRTNRDGFRTAWSEWIRQQAKP